MGVGGGEREMGDENEKKLELELLTTRCYRALPCHFFTSYNCSFNFTTYIYNYVHSTTKEMVCANNQPKSQVLLFNLETRQ